MNISKKISSYEKKPQKEDLLHKKFIEVSLMSEELKKLKKKVEE